MAHLTLLGFADEQPAKITVDTSHPRSMVSEAFLFNNDFNSMLDQSGRNCRNATLSVPTLGGYYRSTRLSLLCSVVCSADIVLGANWLAQCRPVMGGNAFGQPAPETVNGLPDGHAWVANGAFAKNCPFGHQFT